MIKVLNALILISFPVVSQAREEALLLGLLLILLAILAYSFGALFLIYFPIRLIHWLITKKPVASWEKYFLRLTLIFVVPFAIISNFFLN